MGEMDGKSGGERYEERETHKRERDKGIERKKRERNRQEVEKEVS